jgi:protein TonB
VRSILITVALVAGFAAMPGAQEPTHKVGEEGVKSPVLIREVKPKYTEGAMRRKVQGVVEVDAVILKDGTVGDVTVTRSLDEELDQEAIAATKQWRFRPATKDGEPVTVRVNIELTFTLRNKR